MQVSPCGTGRLKSSPLILAVTHVSPAARIADIAPISSILDDVAPVSRLVVVGVGRLDPLTVLDVGVADGRHTGPHTSGAERAVGGEGEPSTTKSIVSESTHSERLGTSPGETQLFVGVFAD